MCVQTCVDQLWENAWDTFGSRSEKRKAWGMLRQELVYLCTCAPGTVLCKDGRSAEQCWIWAELTENFWVLWRYFSTLLPQQFPMATQLVLSITNESTNFACIAYPTKATTQQATLAYGET